MNSYYRGLTVDPETVCVHHDDGIVRMCERVRLKILLRAFHCVAQQKLNFPV